MKRMNEVFELPVSDMDLAYLTSQAEDGSMTFAESKRCKHAAHAINNVDALADALAAALPSLQYNRSISDSADRIYTDAVLALSVYRGAK